MPVIMTDDENLHRRSSDNGFPWWIKAITTIGVPSAIALFLVWFVTTQVRDNISNIRENLNLHAESSIKMMHASEYQDDKLYRLLQRICANSAKTNTERVECFR